MITYTVTSRSGILYLIGLAIQAKTTLSYNIF